jgi:hypothetical protein
MPPFFIMFALQLLLQLLLVPTLRVEGPPSRLPSIKGRLRPNKNMVSCGSRKERWSTKNFKKSHPCDDDDGDVSRSLILVSSCYWPDFLVDCNCGE